MFSFHSEMNIYYLTDNKRCALLILYLASLKVYSSWAFPRFLSRDFQSPPPVIGIVSSPFLRLGIFVAPLPLPSVISLFARFLSLD